MLDALNDIQPTATSQKQSERAKDIIKANKSWSIYKINFSKFHKSPADKRDAQQKAAIKTKATKVKGQQSIVRSHNIRNMMQMDIKVIHQKHKQNRILLQTQSKSNTTLAHLKENLLSDKKAKPSEADAGQQAATAKRQEDVTNELTID